MLDLDKGWLNVEIYLDPKDLGKVLGLCGKVDGDKENDLQHRNSRYLSPLKKPHNEFILSWK